MPAIETGFPVYSPYIRFSIRFFVHSTKRCHESKLTYAFVVLLFMLILLRFVLESLLLAIVKVHKIYLRI